MSGGYPYRHRPLDEIDGELSLLSSLGYDEIYFADQTIFPHTPDEVRCPDVTPEYEASVRRRAEEMGKASLLDHFLEVPIHNKLANRIYWESCDSRDFRHVMERIDVPAGLFFAVPGSIYNPELAKWMAERIPTTSTYLFQGCTHMAPGEKPREFIEAIVDFAKNFEYQKSAVS